MHVQKPRPEWEKKSRELRQTTTLLPFCLKAGSCVTPQRGGSKRGKRRGSLLLQLVCFNSLCVRASATGCSHPMLKHMHKKKNTHSGLGYTVWASKTTTTSFLQLLSWCVGGRGQTGLEVLTSAENEACTHTHTHTQRRAERWVDWDRQV